jgi:4-alpha-glucanotransferase
MAVGLYRDLAVGADPTGVEPWCSQAAVVRDAAIGAPPDIYNPQGQNWGLPPFNPHALRAEGYRSFIDLIRANMRHAGGLRIDHVMALQRLYWIPSGRAPADGGFVRYPLRDLLGILALESQRNRCLVVGEDLGTVPKGFRECLAQANVLSYRVLLFERDQGGYLAPAAYPSLAVAVAGSHDLPTLRSWWTAADLELKEKLGLFPRPQDREVAWSERRRDRADLLEALRRAGLEARADMDIETLVRVAHAFLARTESALALVQLDDITDESTPVNVPTTSTEYPNWRRRLSLTLDQLVRHPRLAALAQILREERGAPAAPSPASSARRPRRRLDQRRP